MNTFSLKVPDYEDPAYKEAVIELQKLLGELGDKVFEARPDLLPICVKALNELMLRRDESSVLGAALDVFEAELAKATGA